MAKPLAGYQVSFQQLENSFVVFVPELNIFTESENLSEAFRSHEEKAADAAEKARAVGLEGIPAGRRVLGADEPSKLRAMIPFFIKAAVVALVGAFLLSAAGISFNYALRGHFKSASQKASRAFVKSFVKEVETFAAKEISGDRDRKIRLALRASVPKLQPYFDELRPLFIGSSVLPCSQ